MFATLLSLVTGVGLRVWAFVAVGLVILALVLSLYVRLERSKAEAAELKAATVQLQADNAVLVGNVAKLMADHEAKERAIAALMEQVRSLNSEHDQAMATERTRCGLLLKAKYKELSDMKGKVIDELGSSGAVGTLNELYGLPRLPSGSH